MMTKSFDSTCFNIVFLLMVISAFAASVYSSKPLANNFLDNRVALENKLQQLIAPEANNLYPLPLKFNTTYIDGQGSTDLYIITDIPYAAFVHFFGSDTWCNALILQIHIKACLQHNDKMLDIYLGSDDYAEPDDVFKFDYKIENQIRRANYLQLSMTAEDGPMDSKNYLIELEMIPATDGKSLLHFHFSAFYGFFIRATINTYLLTAGRNKLGFSILTQEASGKPTYQVGMQGILERNAMRYVLAFLSYLEVNPLGKNTLWFDQGLQRWHRYTEEFYEQLYEIKLPDYIALKKAEYRNQLMLSSPQTNPDSDEEWLGD